MRLFEIVRSNWTILGPAETSISGEPICSISALLSCVSAKYEGSAKGLLVTLERLASDPQGPKMLNGEICHVIDKEADIWQIRKGDFRLLWFYGKGNKVVVAAHIFVKKGQKTPPSEVEVAKVFRRKYLEAIRVNNIHICTGV